MKKIVLIVGARPNYMKAFPVYEALKDDFDVTLIHTGQHFDENMNKVFFEQLNCPKPDINLNLEKKIRAGDLDKKLYIDNEEFLKNKEKVINELKTYEGNLGQLGEIRDKLNEKFQEIKPDMIMVFGDVTSTLAASLTAKNMGIKLAHVESGLRSGDIKMPEEVNRILTDYISDYCFCTEQSGIDNLKNEGKDEDKLFLVGNTMIDTQKKFLDIALKTKHYEKLKLKEGEYALTTLHRPSNVDNLDKLKEIFDDLIELSKTEKIVYPIHPRTKKNLEKLEYLKKINDNKNIILEEPLGYLEFTCLMVNCKYLITDSGGLQEESTALNIPCFTLRENTERPCTLIKNNGTNQLIKRISKLELKESKESMDLWDGKSSNRINDELLIIKIVRYCLGDSYKYNLSNKTKTVFKKFYELSGEKINYDNPPIRRGNFIYDMIKKNNLKGNFYKCFKDNFLVNIDTLTNNVPIIGFNRGIRFINNKKIILFPLDKYQTPDILKKNYYDEVKFENKKDKLIWRGSMTGTLNTINGGGYHFHDCHKNLCDDCSLSFFCFMNYDRFKFCYYTQNNNFVDAGFTNNHDNLRKRYNNLIKNKLTIKELCKYKYHIALNGFDLPTSLPWQLLNNNVTFIPYPFEYESIYTYGLIPWVHFVPIANNFCDFEEKFQTIYYNQNLAKKISKAANKYMLKFMDQKFFNKFSLNILKKYSNLINE